MWFCPIINGKRICFFIPYYQIPIFKIPDPDPGPYRGFMVDATILATINEATKHIADQGIRQALESGVAAGLKGMQARAGGEVSVSLEAPRHG
jgi:hypothetical protein